MSASDFEGQQVIVVVEAPAAQAVKNERGDQGAVSGRSKSASEKKLRGKAQVWEEILTVPSTKALHSWLKEKEASGIKFARKRATSTWRGAKEYLQCTGAGCPAQLEVLYDNTSDDIIVSTNGKDHEHGERPHSGWGMPEKTKRKATSIFRSGVSKTAEMDARLRRAGYTEHTLKQLVAFMGRLRRQSREEATVQEYSQLSVWSGRGRDSPEGSSPPPAEDFESDSPPSPVPTRQSSAGTAVSSRSPRRRDMDEATVRRLVDSSIAARSHAYSPYSQFPVGAALLCADGQIVTGCNVENASYGLTNCAERTAVFRAVADGRRHFTAVAIAADMGDKFVGPCGACRQVLAEFNAEMPVYLAKPDGETKTTSMKELLPMAFLPKDVPFKKD